MIGDEGPLLLGDLFDDEAWQEYDSHGQAERRERWTRIVTSWVAAHDEETTELLAGLSLIELVDLDATLDSLRHEIRRAART